MKNRDQIYNQLKNKLESVGFVLIRYQRPHLQNKKELELVFEHPMLQNIAKKLKNGDRAEKYYLKPLSEDNNSAIGLVTGKTSILHNNDIFIKSNFKDSFKDAPAWVNENNNNVLDILLIQILDFVNKNKVDNDFVVNNLNSFLLTWNPSKWEWNDFYENYESFKRVEKLVIRWSCGNSKNILKGDRVYLIRLGKEPKGIIGSGIAISNCYQAPHWGDSTKYTNYIDVQFDYLIDFNKKSLFNDFVKIDPKNIQQWFPRKSGIQVKPNLVNKLEENWFNFISNDKFSDVTLILNDKIDDDKLCFIEGRSRSVVLTVYERDKHARKVCLKYHGYSCKICDFNFEKTYGKIGKNYIHVHHINPIALIKSEYKIDPIHELVPVCPNCHAIIHSKRPAFTIEEVKRFLNKD